MEILGLFPETDRPYWENILRKTGLTEIRLRAEREGYAYQSGKEFYLTGEGCLDTDRGKARIFSKEYLGKLLLHLCKYSIYAFEDELRAGYLTLEGGHRLGVAGQVVMNGQEVHAIKNISFMNLRICHQIIGFADPVLPWVYEKGELYNTLILSPPGCGKTTLLRDLIRQISAGNAFGEGCTVGVADERAEIGGSYLGIPQNDLGPRTDIMEGCPKKIGLSLLLRSMAPRVLAVDEVGDPADWKYLQEAGRCGVKLLATMHGGTREDICGRVPEGVFDRVIFLGKKRGIPYIRGYWNLKGEKGMG